MADQDPGSPPPAAGTVLRTVLVVANDPDMRIYVRQCLAHIEAIRVREVADAFSARKTTADGIPDLLVVDVDGEGEGAVSRLLGHLPALIDVPLIVITDERRGTRAGASPEAHAAREVVLVKPFNARRLCTEVQRILHPDQL
jgi:DNA-binding NtrC family response regulator